MKFQIIQIIQILQIIQIIRIIQILPDSPDSLIIQIAESLSQCLCNCSAARSATNVKSFSAED